MEFSIIIPTFQNYKYCKLTIDSIKKNSSFSHEIIVHLNGKDDETEKFLLDNNIYYTKSSDNIGLCSGVNIASKKSTKNYLLYSHDDMYFLPDWDNVLADEIEKLVDNKFYLSMTQISYTGPVKGSIQHIQFDCGNTIENFNEVKLLNEYKSLKFKNLQGSHWAPHLIHKSIWNKIGGFSKEFNPGFASDPDLNMKLWNEGVRIFKGISESRLYHFGSITTRKKENIRRNDGKKTFLQKWGITVEFFVKHYLKRGIVYDGPLKDPNKDFFYFIDYIIAKSKYYFVKILK